MVYFAFIHSNLNYGIEIYANTYNSYLNKLMILNNKILRILQSAPRYAHVKYLYSKGVISTGQTRLRFGSVWFRSVHFGCMRGQNHVRFTLVQHGVCLHNKF